MADFDEQMNKLKDEGTSKAEEMAKKKPTKDDKDIPDKQE